MSTDILLQWIKDINMKKLKDQTYLEKVVCGMRYFLENGADVNDTSLSDEKNDILMETIKHNKDSFHVIRELLESNYNINHTNIYKQNALHIACNLKNKKEQTPNRLDTIKLLVQYGIPVNMDENNKSPFDFSYQYKLTEITKILKKSLNSGIYLNNHVIKRISKPSGLAILVPKNNKNKNIYFPSLLLFGDAHNEKTGECHGCFEKNDCYSMDDKDMKILKLFEPYVDPSKDKFIDVYTEIYGSHLFEDMDSWSQTKKKNAWTIQKFMYYSKDCYDYKSKCPVPLLRWHYGDSRHSTRKGENTIEYELTFSNMLYRTLYDLGYYENAKKPRKLVHTKSVKKILEAFKNKDSFENMIIRFVDQFIEEIMKAESNSVIAKQIKKSPLSIETIKELAVSLIWKSVQYDKIRDVNSIGFSYFVNKILPSYADSYPDVKSEEGSEQFDNLFSFLFDLYTILRMIKTTAVPPLLAISYMGQTHVNNIVYALTTVLGYEIVYLTEMTFDMGKGINRCMKMNKIVNMDKIVNDSYQRYKIYNSYKNNKNNSKSVKNVKK